MRRSMVVAALAVLVATVGMAADESQPKTSVSGPPLHAAEWVQAVAAVGMLAVGTVIWADRRRRRKRIMEAALPTNDPGDGKPLTIEDRISIVEIVIGRIFGVVGLSILGAFIWKLLLPMLLNLLIRVVLSNWTQTPEPL